MLFPLRKILLKTLKGFSFCIELPPLLILSVICVTWMGFRYAQFLSSLRDVPRPTGHIFLLDSFVLRNSTTFGTRDRDTLALFFAAPQGTEARFAYCASGDALFDIEQGIPATVIRLGRRDDGCFIASYLLHCPLEISTKYARISTATPIGVGFLGSAALQIFPRRLRTSRRKSLVICMGELVGFEKWQLLIAGLEVHRYLGVERVVLYIHTTADKILNLLEKFVKTYPNYLEIRPLPNGLPSSGDFGFEPEFEWDTSSFPALSHQICLLEHRETSAFVALIQPEDVLLPLSSALLPPQELVSHLWGLRHANAEIFSIGVRKGGFSKAAVLRTSLDALLQGLYFGEKSADDQRFIVRGSREDGRHSTAENGIEALSPQILKQKRRRRRNGKIFALQKLFALDLAANDQAYTIVLDEMVDKNSLKRGNRFWDNQVAELDEAHWDFIRNCSRKAPTTKQLCKNALQTLQMYSWAVALFTLCARRHNSFRRHRLARNLLVQVKTGEKFVKGMKCLQ